MTRLLAIDTGDIKHTGVYTLYNSDKTDSFMFENAQQLRDFTLRYYHNPIAALFAYRCVNG